MLPKLILNIPLFPHLLPDKKEVIYLVLLFGEYILSLQAENLLLCMLIYTVTYVVLTYLMVREVWEFGKQQVYQLYEMLKNIVANIKIFK